jgi:hypothetical protein
MTKPTNADLARELVAAKAHIAELEAARPDHIEQPAVDLTVARRSYLALVPKPAAEAWDELVTIAKHMGFDLPEAPPRNTTEPHNKERVFVESSGQFCGLMLEKAVHCLGILHYGCA